MRPFPDHGSHDHRHVVVLANPQAGLFLRDAGLERSLQDVLPAAALHVVKGQRLARVAREAVEDGADVVVAAGGDGTVNSVASALVGTRATLGILPLGTLNHFAKDLGLPLSLADAAKLLANPDTRNVDVGRIGRHIFVNNASFGLYPRVLETREALQALQRGRWPAMAVAMLEALKRAPTLTAQLQLSGREITAKTPFIFVGNNPYEVSLFSIGGRPRLDTGQLGVYYSRRSGRAALLRLSWRAFTGRLAQESDFRAHETPRVRIDTPRIDVKVALDGEVHRLRPPLHLEIVPAGLQVAAPGVAA